MPKILAIDDKRDNLITLTALLRNLMPDCEVITAQSGIEGINLAIAEQPDAILLDIQMPVMDGFEVCRRLKADQRTRSIPVVMVTAVRTDSPSRIKGLEIGADAFLSKPIDEQELVSQLKVVLRIKAAEEALRVERDSLEILVRERTAELQKSEAQFRALFENSTSGIVIHAPDSSVLLANSEASRILGLTLQQMQGKVSTDATWNFLREDGQPLPHEAYPVSRVLSSGKPVTGHIFAVCQPNAGVTNWVLCNAYAQVDAKGLLMEVVVSFSDITEYKRMQAAIENRILALTRPLADSSAVTFDELFDRKKIQRIQDEFAAATDVASIITLPDGTPLTEPSNFTRLCRDIIRKTEKGCTNCFSSDAELGRDHPEGPIIQPCLSSGLWDAGVSITVGHQHVANWLIGQIRDGTQRDESMRAYAREIGADESEFMVAYHDVPVMSRNHFEKIAHALFSFANQLSTTAYLNLQQARFIADEKKNKANLLRLSTAIEQSPETVVITDVDGAIQYVNPAFEKISGYTVSEALGQNPRVLKSGLQDEAFYQELWKTISNGKTWSSRIVNKRKNGTFYTEDATISPVFDDKGLIVNYVAVKRDITDHLALAAQFEQAQKMESVGRLAGGVAHDFNNMLQAILGHTEMAQEQVDPASPIFADLQEVRKAAERSANLTRQLLTFARKQTISPRVIDLNETVEGMFKMLRRLIGEDIDLIWLPGKNLHPVKVDPSQIDQVLTNLCVNAQDAIGGVGTITLTTGSAAFDVAWCVNHTGYMPGEYVLLAVRDTGCGMSPEILSHLFEPFFTTKEVGKGTGLGLATVYGVVQQNNGFIHVESELGKGTVFRIYLPQQAPLLPLEFPPEVNQPIERGSETILLVEDEPSILNMTTTMLTRLGYTVLPAACPEEAIRLAPEHIGGIDLLMTDVVMPGMNGRDLSVNLLSFYPELKSLFMSGYTADVISRNGVLDEGVHFIQKPFAMQELAAKVREALK